MKSPCKFFLNCLESFKHCVNSRPPLVLFTLGICLLGVMFTALALYIQETDLVADPNFTTDWDLFLTDLTGLKFSENCAKGKKKDVKPDDANLENDDGVSVRVEWDGDGYESTFSDSSVAYEVFLTRGDILIREKLSKSMKKDVIKLTFTGIANESSTGVCVTVSNSSLLSYDITKPQLCEPARASKTKLIKLCDEPGAGTRLKLKHKSDVSLKMYLTLDDKVNIHIHLMSTSYFMFVMTIAILLWALMRKKPSQSETVANGTVLQQV